MFIDSIDTDTRESLYLLLYLLGENLFFFLFAENEREWKKWNERIVCNVRDQKENSNSNNNSNRKKERLRSLGRIRFKFFAKQFHRLRNRIKRNKIKLPRLLLLFLL